MRSGWSDAAHMYYYFRTLLLAITGERYLGVLGRDRIFAPVCYREVAPIDPFITPAPFPATHHGFLLRMLPPQSRQLLPP